MASWIPVPDSWVPDSCTLPDIARPLREAEFDGLMGRGLLSWSRTSARRLRWVLRPELSDIARGLVARETSCCSFFSFELHPEPEGLVVDVEVPPTRVEVLDALQVRTAAVQRPG